MFLLNSPWSLGLMITVDGLSDKTPAQACRTPLVWKGEPVCLYVFHQFRLP